MNDATHAAYQAYIRQVADLLLLRDWELTLSRETPNHPTAHAAVHVCAWENQALVYLDHPNVFGHSLEERREWICHELLHIHLDRPQRIVDQLGDLFPDNTATSFAREAHRNEIEICVQRLARILAPLLPLPP